MRLCMYMLLSERPHASPSTDNNPCTSVRGHVLSETPAYEYRVTEEHTNNGGALGNLSPTPVQHNTVAQSSKIFGFGLILQSIVILASLFFSVRFLCLATNLRRHRFPTYQRLQYQLRVRLCIGSVCNCCFIFVGFFGLLGANPWMDFSSSSTPKVIVAPLVS